MLNSYAIDTMTVHTVTRDKFSTTTADVTRVVRCKAEYGLRVVANGAGQMVNATQRVLVPATEVPPDVGQVVETDGQYTVVARMKSKDFTSRGWECYLA